MAEDTKTRELIESVVAEAFDLHVRALHDEVVGRVMQSIDTLEKNRQEKPVSEWLKAAVEGIEASTQQTEILKALLDSTQQFCERAALLVLRGTTAVMWQGRGFPDNDVLRTVSLDVSVGPCAVVVTQQVLAAKASDVHQKFADGGERSCVLVPLTIRDKVGALLYCDAADESLKLDAAALDLLARSAGKWIELQAFRKTAGAPAAAPRQNAAAQSAAPVPPPAAAVSTPARQEAPEPAPEQHVPVVHAATVPSTAAAPAGGIPEHEQELHKKARRFAKLLVDEIILYNREKVNEGRRNQDIYDRLKDDIDKSRATYEKRFGDTSVARFEYFKQAVVSGLAEHNMTLLGSNFPR